MRKPHWLVFAVTLIAAVINGKYGIWERIAEKMLGRGGGDLSSCPRIRGTDLRLRGLP